MSRDLSLEVTPLSRGLPTDRPCPDFNIFNILLGPTGPLAGYVPISAKSLS